MNVEYDIFSNSGVWPRVMEMGMEVWMLVSTINRGYDIRFW